MTDLPLELIRSFLRVAAHQSFARAAQDLRLTPSAVSRQIKQLEQTLGAQLFLRTTRTMSLTEAGSTYLAAAREAFDQLEAAGQALGRLRDEVQGELRISAPVAFGRRHVAPALPRFMGQHPRLSLELVMTDSFVDLARERVDLAVRVGALDDSGLRARKLASNRRILVASPDYLVRRGAPRSIEDLRRHSGIVLTVNRDGESWRLLDGKGKATSVKPMGSLRANNGDAVLEFAKAGAGIAFLSSMMVRDALVQESLVQVLPQYAGLETGVHAVFLADPVLSPKLRALIDFLVELFQQGTTATVNAAPGIPPHRPS